jgi:hypothetical protein
MWSEGLVGGGTSNYHIQQSTGRLSFQFDSALESARLARCQVILVSLTAVGKRTRQKASRLRAG